jgi:hypothetical protein
VILDGVARLIGTSSSLGWLAVRERLAFDHGEASRLIPDWLLQPTRSMTAMKERMGLLDIRLRFATVCEP